MDAEDLLSLWQLELPSILGVAAPGSEVLDDESATFDMNYDSSEEARYEQAAIEADADHDQLMAHSTDSEAGEDSESGLEHVFLHSLPTVSPELCYNTMLPANVDLGCFQPRCCLEAAAKKALARGMVDGELIARMVDVLPNSVWSIHKYDNFGSKLSPRAFTAGAYIHGPHAGMHMATLEYEILVLVLISVVRSMRPDCIFLASH